MRYFEYINHMKTSPKILSSKHPSFYYSFTTNEVYDLQRLATILLNPQISKIFILMNDSICAIIVIEIYSFGDNINVRD